MATVFEGGAVAKSIKESLRGRIGDLLSKGVTPKIKVMLVGENGASMSYVRMIEKGFSKEGLISELVSLPESISEEDFLKELDAINNDKDTHGVLVQLPLPKHIDQEHVLEFINPIKDLDGFHPYNIGKLVVGEDTYNPCTPFGVIKMLDYYGVDCNGKNVVVLGRSNIVGKPISLLMLQKNSTVTICHSKTKDLSSVTRAADILIVAIGKCQFVTKDMVGEGAVVIDVGIHDVDGKILGDVNFEEVSEVASAITPVPGGVGSTTIATLMENLVKAAEAQS